MKISKLAVIAGLMTVTGIATQAQGPQKDKIIVDLPYSVTIKDMTLPPGHYIIRQLDDTAGASRVLQIFDGSGMRLETTAMTIPALDPKTPEKTTVLLHHYGNDYYFDKIWVQGKNYGYEFPINPNLKSREKERLEPAVVAATYEVPQETTPAPPAPVVAQVETPAPTPAPEPVVVAPAPAPEPVVAAPTSIAMTAPETSTMPHTASNWMVDAIFGLCLLGFGIALRIRTA